MTGSRPRLLARLLPGGPLGRLSGFARPQRFRLAVAAGLGVLNALLAIAPFLVAYRVASLALGGNSATLAAELPLLAIAAGAAILTRSLAAARSSMIAHEAAYDLIRDLRLGGVDS